MNNLNRNLRLILVLLVSSSIADAQEGEVRKPVSLQEYCVTNECRKDVAFDLRTDGETFKARMPFYLPAVQQNRISILPGEELYIEAEREQERLVSFRQVQSIEKPEKTLRIRLEQREGTLNMMMTVENPFEDVLKYRVNMVDFKRNPHQTSSCPVNAHASVFEDWPHPIPELLLSDFRFLADSEKAVCEY